MSTKEDARKEGNLRIENISRLYTVSGGPGLGRCVSDAEIVIKEGRMVFAGSADESPARQVWSGPSLDAGGGIVTPGLIDCHTHLVWAGSRQNEFAMRCSGVDYKEIAAQGGGIVSSMRSVRQASEDELVAAALPRADRFVSFGVTTAEIKSGYGLDTESELKMLRAARRVGEESPLTVVTTFLGAHTVPPEYRSHREKYVDLVVEEMLPAVAEERLATYCDVFVEDGAAFSPAEARRILLAGKELGLRPRVHVDQLSAGGGAELAAELGAISADHLESISDAGIRALSAAGVVAVMIPGSTLCLGQQRFAPARKLIDAGVEVAISTDVNPGTTCSENLPLMGTLACTRMGISPSEALRGMTAAAAHALELEGRKGSLAEGMDGDLVIWNAPDTDYLFYHYGVYHAQHVIKAGEVIRSH